MFVIIAIGMTMLNAQLVVVERQKVVDYLLNPAHPDNGGKAQFFMSKGFAVSTWETFAAALRQLAIESPVATTTQTEHGTKYIVEGPLQTPAADRPIVRSVWIIDAGAANPRLVTAYPRT